MRSEQVLNILEKEIEVITEAKQQNGLSMWAAIAAAATLFWMSMDKIEILFFNYEIAVAWIVVFTSAVGILEQLTKYFHVDLLLKEDVELPIDADDLSPTVWTIWVTFQNVIFSASFPLLALVGAVPKWSLVLSIPAFLFNALGIFALIFLLRVGKFVFSFKKPTRKAIQSQVHVRAAYHVIFLFLAVRYIYCLGAGHQRLDIGKHSLLIFAGCFLVQTIAKLSNYEATYAKLNEFRRKLLFDPEDTRDAELYLMKFYKYPRFEGIIEHETEAYRKTLDAFDEKIRNLEDLWENYVRAYVYMNESGAPVSADQKIKFDEMKNIFDELHSSLASNEVIEKEMQERLQKWVRFSEEGKRMVGRAMIEMIQRRLGQLEKQKKITSLIFGEGHILIARTLKVGAGK